MSKQQEQAQRELKTRRELSRLRGDDPTLTAVCFSHLNGAKVREIAVALRCNTHLKILSLHCLEVEVGDGVDAAIADIIRVNRSLKELEIKGAAEVREVADAPRCNTHLKILRLLHLKIGCRLLDCEAIANIIRVNRSLKELDIAECQIGNGGAKAIAAALSDNNTLTQLYLRASDIGPVGAEAIAAALSERNESGGRAALICLSLSDNAIGDDGGRALAAMLRSNTSITSLNLEDCGIGDDTAIALAAALVANDTVQTLFLSNNRIGDVGAKALAAALVYNDTIEMLFLSNNRIGDVGVKALVAANLLRLRCCDIYLNNVSIGKDAWSAFDLYPAAIALIEQLLPATNFISLSAILATKAAALRSAHPPKPGRLAILDTAQRLIIDHVLAQTRLIPDAAMPLALEKIGESGDDDKNAIGHRSDTGINYLFEVCIDKPHLFKGAHMDEGMDGQGQGQEEEECGAVYG